MTACTDYSGEIESAYDDYNASVNGGSSANNNGGSGSNNNGGSSSIDSTDLCANSPYYIPCGDLWCGCDRSIEFEYGTWTWYTDMDDGGYSVLNFYSVENAPRVRAEYALGGDYTNSKGKKASPYASLVAEFEKPLDMTSWSGICVSYASNTKARLMLAFSNDSLFDYDRPSIWLEATLEKQGNIMSPVVIDLGWETFKTGGWYNGTPVETAYAISVAEGFDFQFAKPGSYDSGNLYIYSIGRFGTCK